MTKPPTNQPNSSWDPQLETEAVRSPEWSSEINRPQAESISLASVWQMDSPETADAALAGQDGVFVYRREGHPNERTLSRKLGNMHGSNHAIITAQGMSALGAVALGLLKPGATVWVAEELYGKSVQLFAKDMPHWNVGYQTFDPTQQSELDRLGKEKPDLVLVETLSNPRLKLPDLQELAQAVHQGSGLLMVDNTFATHLLCRPLDFGADIVVESLGKQVNGHSDAMLGLIICKDASDHQSVAATVSTFGMASSPFDCFLTQRGLATLALRMERTCQNALALSQALERLSCVRQVDYPGLASHPQHQLACDQLAGGFGWMSTIHLDLDSQGVLRLFDLLRPEIPFVPSLGDVCTSVSHPTSTSHRGLQEEQRGALGIYPGTIRISCGIEPTEWLVDRFTQAVKESC